MIGFSLVFSLAAAVTGVEKLERGLVAIEREDGSVFLSWRLLESDADGIAFEVSRRCLEDLLEPATVLIAGQPYRPTNFVDKTAEKDKKYLYELREYSGKWKPEPYMGRACWEIGITSAFINAPTLLCRQIRFKSLLSPSP
ncbi:unnamed protein product, partial [marine sediment metagenome]